MSTFRRVRFVIAAALFGGSPALFALAPEKSLTQYSRTIWTQAQGLPQDTIRAITQTTDGFLWLGTDEGLARFTGYEFVAFTKDNSALPSNSITALWPADGAGLWIGTPNGLVFHQNGQFLTYTTKDGLPDNAITYIRTDHKGTLWVVAGGFLSRFENGRFATIEPQPVARPDVVRVVYEDRERQLWIAGGSNLVKRAKDGFSAILGPKEMHGRFATTTMLEDHKGDLWIGGSNGLIVLQRDGSLRRYDSRNGLPNNLVRALWEDRSDTIWAGTDAGLSRLENGRFVSAANDKNQESDWVKCLFEDREGNLWLGMNSGLNRFRSDLFTSYGRPEGLPSDAPLAVHQDEGGRMWIGYHDVGLMKLLPDGFRLYTAKDGLAGNEVFNIRAGRNGDLLIATRSGLSRMQQERFTNYVFNDPLAGHPVFDAMETSTGRFLVARGSGVHELVGQAWRNLIPGGPVVNNYPIVLSEGPDGIWAGTYGIGLWQLPTGSTQPRLWTTADGLSSNQIRSLHWDDDGALWIGTFGGGLNVLRSGAFSKYTARDGLLSDNISHVEDDGRGNLWLSTTRGICRVAKRQLDDFSAGRIKALTPDNYSVEDGLRSAQCAPGYPVAGGGTKSRDGRLWFSTGRGLATIDPNALSRRTLPPIVHMLEVVADGHNIEFSHPQKFEPGMKHIQLRYAGIHLSAPERIRYAYKLDGLNSDWEFAGSRRIVSYNTLKHGIYRFVVRAMLPEGTFSESSFEFEVLPHFYERAWFLWMCGGILLASGYGIYRWRLAQIHGRFSLVLEERMRLAREIHDTLAQGFVGIGSQLDAVTLTLNDDPQTARQHLDVARKMASHSLTEARRSVIDLRAEDTDERDLAATLMSAAKQWVAGTPTQIDVEVSGEPSALPRDVKQNLLRIAQEAVANSLKHAGASAILVKLQFENGRLRLGIKDDGKGFDTGSLSVGGDEHFGILGMRERAKRLGGELDLTSRPGEGAIVEVNVPILA